LRLVDCATLLWLPNGFRTSTVLLRKKSKQSHCLQLNQLNYEQLLVYVKIFVMLNVFNTKQTSFLKDLFDADSNGKLGPEEVRAVLKALDIDEDDDDIDDDTNGNNINTNNKSKNNGVKTVQRLFAAADKDGSGEVDFDELQTALASHTFYQLEEGRYFVALSLPEAAALRRLLHAVRRAEQRQQSSALIPRAAQLALLIGGGAAGHAAAAPARRLDATPQFRAGSRHQRHMALQCLRFFDSEVDYGERAVNVLLRAMQHTPLAARQRFFETVRARRRRKQTPWQRTAVARFLVTPDHYELLTVRATVSRVRWLLGQRRMGPAEAFSAFDVTGAGKLLLSVD
jgi:Ca2+-binding EF-hand superfamily protein